MKMLHVITDLNGYGGTEKTLLRYLAGTDRTTVEHVVFVLKSCGTVNTVGSAIRELGVPVREFGLQSRANLLPFPVRFIRALRGTRPDVISAWLYHPIFMAELFRPFAVGSPRIVWHIRNLPSYAHGPGLRNGFRRAFLRMVGLLSRRSDALIVANSTEAVAAHQAIGYRQAGWHVVRNGIDFHGYRADPVRRRSVREALRIRDDEFVITAVGRFVPEKGYSDLFEAVARSAVLQSLRQQGKLRFLGVGQGVSEESAAFVSLCAPVFDRSSRNLLGRQEDVQSYLAAGDLFILSSVSESFPNVLIEAMASGLPVVATQVGGVADLGLDPAVLAMPRDSLSIASAIDRVLGLDAEHRAEVTRRQQEVVRERYSTHLMNRRFDELLTRGDA